MVEGAERVSEGGVGRYGGARRDGDASFRFVRTRVGWAGDKTTQLARWLAYDPQLARSWPHARITEPRHSGTLPVRPSARVPHLSFRQLGVPAWSARGGPECQAERRAWPQAPSGQGPHGSGGVPVRARVRVLPAVPNRPAQQTVGGCVTSPNRIACRRAAECSPSSSLLVCGPPVAVCLLVVTANSDGVYTCQ